MSLYRFIGFAYYLGIGALLHAVILGSHFDSSNVWSWALLFGWPAVTTALLLTGLAVVMLVVLVLLMAGVLA